MKPIIDRIKAGSEWLITYLSLSGFSRQSSIFFCNS
jgi:hypothetical protein